MKIIQAIKRAVLADKRTRYRIAKDSGVSESQLSKLVNGKMGLNVRTVEALANTLDLEIIVRPKRRTGKSKGR
jgi:transcriptional regulator with XRE-family HTH domain